MDQLMENIKEKIEKRLDINFEGLNTKQKERLILIESLLSESREKQELILQELKNSKLNKVNISEKLKISRKTLYNDDIAKEYIDVFLKEQEERLRLGKNKIDKEILEKDYETLKIQHDKLLCNIIDLALIKEENEYLKRQVESLARQNEELRVLLYNNDKVIRFTEKRGKK